MDPLARRVQRIQDVIRFGEEELGLYFGGNLRETYLGRDTLFYFVWNSFRTRLEEAEPMDVRWNDKAAAEKQARALEDKGLDAYVCKVVAWADPRKDCPLTQYLLSQPFARQAWTVLHEGFHYTMNQEGLYLTEELSEALAYHTGFAGALQFFQRFLPLQVEACEREREVHLAFADFINTHTAKLDEAYMKGTGTREAVLRKAGEDLPVLNALRWDLARKSAVERAQLNNAFFLCYHRTNGLVRPISRFLQDRPIPEYIANIEEVLEEMAETLKEPCGALTGTRAGSRKRAAAPRAR